MLVAVALVRFVAMPLLSLGLVEAASRAGWLPADPACRLALLVVVRLPDRAGVLCFGQAARPAQAAGCAGAQQACAPGRHSLAGCLPAAAAAKAPGRWAAGCTSGSYFSAQSQGEQRC